MALKPQDVTRIKSRRLPLRVLQAALTAKDVTTAKLKQLFGRRHRKEKPRASGISKLERRMLRRYGGREHWLERLGSDVLLDRAERAAKLRDRFDYTNQCLKSSRKRPILSFPGAGWFPTYKRKHPLTGKPEPTGRRSGNSHQRRVIHRRVCARVVAVDKAGGSVTFGRYPMSKCAYCTRGRDAAVAEGLQREEERRAALRFELGERAA